MADKDALFEWLLRLADNAVVLSHRLSEWCGHGPVLEEDLALANVSLDLIGQARLWLSYAGEVEGAGRDEDKLAFMRDSTDYHNVLLLEQPNGDYALTMARQFYFDTWHFHFLKALCKSSDQRVAEIAEKSVKEVTYHLGRSTEWVAVLGDGTEESHARMQTAIDDLWMYTGEMFEMDTVEQAMAKAGISVDLATLHDPWLAHVRSTLGEATLTVPQPSWMQRGGKRGIHSEHMGFMLAEMQFLQRAYPGATW